MLFRYSYTYLYFCEIDRIMSQILRSIINPSEISSFFGQLLR